MAKNQNNAAANRSRRYGRHKDALPLDQDQPAKKKKLARSDSPKELEEPEADPLVKRKKRVVVVPPPRPDSPRNLEEPEGAKPTKRKRINAQSEESNLHVEPEPEPEPEPEETEDHEEPESDASHSDTNKFHHTTTTC